MKKTYVLQFDYDESKKTLNEVFGVTVEQIQAIERRYEATRSKTKSEGLMSLLDSGEEIPGGVLMMMLANHMSASRSSSRSILSMLAMASMVGSEDMKSLLGGREHDCEHCEGYDDCGLPFKKPRDGEPS